MKDYGRRTALLTIGIAALAMPASAGAAVTIGSNLQSAPTRTLLCPGSPCTTSHISLPASSTSPGGLVAPIDGVVVRWRIKVENDVSPVALRITRPGIGAIRTGAGTGPTVTPAANAISTYDVQLPIQQGDAVGIDCCQDPENLDAYSDTAGANYSFWNPRLQDGGPLRVVSPIAQELLVNADIEPDCDGDGAGDETQDANVSSCHTRTLALDANKRRVGKGRNVRLSGHIVETRQGGACAANQPVELQRKRPGRSTFATVKQLQTDAAGSFSTKKKVKKTFVYRAQVAESPGCNPAVSDTKKVKVKKK